jgi:UDP-N-acetylmuramoyl-tripeptide--D-alanyl-D-alanine ligase
MMTLAQAHALLPGSVLVGRGDIVIERVHSDTRTLRAGDLFVALKGERFDGHDYLAQARAAGAVAALAERGLTLESIPGLQVPDSLQGLQRVSAAWRAQFDLPLIAVTGSNGKTTVTQMLAAILRAWHCDAALATAGNFNNHIGVPLTLLRLRATHRCAVLELGMNHAGEIALLARLAAPTVALVNNAQREHQEFMDGVEAVARENGSVFEALPADGVAVVPAGDAFAPLWAHMAGARRLMSFGAGPSAGRQAGVFAEAAVWSTQHAAWMLQLRTPDGPLETRLHLPGAHNLHNALAAATGALAAGAPLAAIAAGIDAFRPVAGRSHTRTLRWRGVRVCERPARDAYRRQLQRQPRFDARRHRRAGQPARPALAVDGRHGRGGRTRPGLPRRGGCCGACCGHRARMGCRRVDGACRGATPLRRYRGASTSVA